MKQFTVALALLCSFTHASNARRQFEVPRIPCGSDSYPCGDNSRCVKGRSLCDHVKDCDDFSDESLSFCKRFHEKRGGCSIPGELFHPEYRCRSIVDICSSDYKYSESSVERFRSLCDEIKNGLPPNEDFTPKGKELSDMCEKRFGLQGESNLKEVFGVLAASFDASKESKSDSICPRLYVLINGKCVSLFTVAKVTWFEAQEFCESISGTLAILNNMSDYQALLEHLQLQGLTTDFWIGGHYATTKSANPSRWAWLDETAIDLGPPYWGLYQTQNCTRRGTAPLCYNYSLAPRESRDGFCLSLDFAFHFYFMDQNCHKPKSPICVLNKK